MFLNSDKNRTEKVLNNIKNKKSDFWMRERERQSLSLFHKAAKRVPAYKDFLQKNKIQAEKIKTWQDFQSVPIIDKKNYLKQYPLEQLCWDGSLKKPLVFTSTSGSTGEPFYFPRSENIDWQSSLAHELFLKQSFEYNKQSTLVIVCFGMGVWIGGLITYEAFEMASRRSGYPVSILTPGINKEEIFKALKNLGGKFDQTILVGYPPFIKDVIDEAPLQGIDLESLNLRLIFAAEVFTEGFRDYVAQKTGMKNPYLDIMHIYGSADIGTMAWETGVATLIKRLSLKNPDLFNKLFSQINKTPTLAQFNPSFVSFEAPDGEVLLTGDNAIPLVRYAIGDKGGVLSFDDAVSELDRLDYDFRAEAKKVGIDNFIVQLPMVYVYERSDFSTKLYGAIMHPEHIRDALYDYSLERFITGRFTMSTELDDSQNQYLEINIELKSNIESSDQLKGVINDTVIKTLLEKNSEYKNNYNLMPDRVVPMLKLWPYEHPQYFKAGIKQKWIKKK